MVFGEVQLPVEQVRARLDEVRLVDVREPYEFEAGHITGIEHVPLDRLGAALDPRPGEPIVFVCRSGARSGMAAMALRRHGIDAWSLDGGMLAWEATGGPLEPPDGHVAAH